ncbi:MAG: SMC-Scp complex subunit ScpB [Vampirovibrionales bacterium]|nr:SMC-Scp complex subunit ScpB [Vampirovibrionales bacterium]
MAEPEQQPNQVPHTTKETNDESAQKPEETKADTPPVIHPETVEKFYEGVTVSEGNPFSETPPEDQSAPEDQSTKNQVATNSHTKADEEPPSEQERQAIDPIQLKADIEAVLFITAKPLSLQEISELVEAPVEDVEMTLGELIQDFAFREGSGLEIDDTDGYILQVREDCARIVHKMMPLEMSPAIIRTLSAIAIKAPILQSDLIELRGSTAYDHISELLSKKMISKRRQGRSYVLNTTKAFDDYFKLSGNKKELETLVNRLKPEHKTAKGDTVSQELEEIPPMAFEHEEGISA